MNSIGKKSIHEMQFPIRYTPKGSNILSSTFQDSLNAHQPLFKTFHVLFVIENEMLTLLSSFFSSIDCRSAITTIIREMVPQLTNS